MKASAKFFQSDSAGGFVLIAAAVAAMFAANTSLAPAYQNFTAASHFAINDILMAVFFLLAGLEIKKEFVSGALSTPRQAMLPLIAALCGMAVPAIIYLFIVTPDLRAGWAIPSATDIAFALGVLALVPRMPKGLKVLLLSIAVIDDLGAILIIAFFYSAGISAKWLGCVVIITAALMLLNRLKVTHYVPYFGLGALLLAALWYAGVHPTIGGVILAFCIPVSRMDRLQHSLHPWVVFGIMPLFGFANAGVSLAGIGVQDLAHPLALGIGAGLVAGKCIGIGGAILLLTKTRVCALPAGVGPAHILGLSLLCGVGFTMALFIGNLAFSASELDVYIRMGVISGSIVSGLLGYTVLSYGAHPRSHQGL